MNAVVMFVLLYVLIQIRIGVYLFRRIHSQEDYLLAGRKPGYTLGTFTIFATWFESETCIGSAGQVYDNGIFMYSAEPIGYGLELMFIGAVCSKKASDRLLPILSDCQRQICIANRMDLVKMNMWTGAASS